MSHPLHAWLMLATLLGGQASSFGAEPLHPAFADESERDPFVTPIKAQISGPLDGERLDESWDRDKLFEKFAPVQEPGQVFLDADDDPDAELSAVPVVRQRPLIDSSITLTWLAPIDGFGVSDMDAKSTLLIPVMYKGSPIRLAMGYGTTFMNTPAGFDVPSQLYSIQAELRWLIALRERLAVDLGAGGGLFSDFNGSGLNGSRATGRAILVKTVSDRLKLSAGVLYIGRANLKAIPIVGLIYTPDDDVRIELLIPRSRIARRMFYTGNREHWFYAGLELFGGNSWAIEQPGGVQNVVIYKDNRLLVGYETKAVNALAGRVEVGYVFSRKLQIGDDSNVLSPGGTMLLRVGVTY